MAFKNHCAIAKNDIQKAPKPANNTPEKVLPVRSWMMPAISCARPPNISATPNTTGVTPTAIAFALIMLSMNVVTAKANRASGAELPQSRVVALCRAPSSSVPSRTDRAETVAMMQSLLRVRRKPQRTVVMTNIAQADIHVTTPHHPSNKQAHALTMPGTQLVIPGRPENPQHPPLGASCHRGRHGLLVRKPRNPPRAHG